MVGMRGFEPPAPSSRTKCATRLRYIPIHFYWKFSKSVKILFVPNITVDAFGFEGLVGDVPFHILGLLAFGTFYCFVPDFGYLHFNDKVVLAFFAGMIVVWHVGPFRKKKAYNRFRTISTLPAGHPLNFSGGFTARYPAKLNHLKKTSTFLKPAVCKSLTFLLGLKGTRTSSRASLFLEISSRE